MREKKVMERSGRFRRKGNEKIQSQGKNVRMIGNEKKDDTCKERERERNAWKKSRFLHLTAN